MAAADLEQPPAPRRDASIVRAAAAARSRAARPPRRGRRRPPCRGRGRAARRPTAARAAGPCRSAAGVEIAVRARLVAGRRHRRGRRHARPPGPREHELTAADAATLAFTAARRLPARIHSPPCRAHGSPSSFPPTTRRGTSSRRSPRCATASRRSGRPWELIVVDNASPDGTADALVPLTEADERIRVLRNDDNRGKGYSVRRGMLAAAGELRLHCDADCAASFASLPALLAALDEGADVVVGSRLAKGARRRAAPAAAAPHRRAHVRAPVPRRPARADQRPVLRLQAVARVGRHGGLPARPARRLDVRRRDAGARARPRLPPPRGRRGVERPRGLAAVDAAGARAGRARAGLRRARHVRREVARAAPDSAEAASSA